MIDQRELEAARSTLASLGYTYHGGTAWKPPLGKRRLSGDPLFGDPCGPWIKVFAWWPVFTFDGGTVWLRRVWKRHIHKHPYLDGGLDYWWQYRRFWA